MDQKMPRAALDLAALSFAFAETYRVTLFPDGVTLESDTDHTVMLGLIACAYAAAEAPHLDLGKIAQFALVHDLVEAYAGDTDSFGIHTDDAKRVDKENREAQALARIEKEFNDTFPWLTKMIHEYESLKTPEARFIKTIDKVLPKLTHTLNDCAYLPSKEAFDEHVMRQEKAMKESYAADQEAALELYSALNDNVRETFTRKKPRASQASVGVSDAEAGLKRPDSDPSSQ